MAQLNNLLVTGDSRFLNEINGKIDWSNINNKPAIGTGSVTSVAASGTGGISVSGSPITTSGTLSIGVNGSTVINNLTTGDSNAQRTDYIVAQYAGGGTTTTTYHRRPLSKIFAALNKSDITTALGYTPPTEDTNTTYSAGTGVTISGTNNAINVTYGTAANTACQGNDSRLSNARPSSDVVQTYSSTSTVPISGKGVAGALETLPKPMVFKGSLGTNGTITTLPTNGSATVGDTYKVITVGTYASQAAKVGDMFICDSKTSSANTWVYIPSADDSGVDSWRNIKVNGTEKLGTAISTGAVDFVNGTNTTVSYNATGNKISINSTDTKNTAGSTDTSSKLFLIGATSQAASSQTYSQDTAYVGTDGRLYSGDNKVLTEADSYKFIGDIVCSNGTIEVSKSAVSGSPSTYTVNVQPWLVTDYGECDTAAATAAKVVNVTSNSFYLYSGVTVRIKFDYTNTASAPTLNVNSTGAKNIVKWGTTAVGTSTSTSWTAGSIVSFTYDGTSWVMNDHIDDTDTNNAVLQSPTTTNNNFEVLFSHSANNTEETASVGKSSGFLYNPNTGAVTIGNRASGTVGARSFAQGESLVASGVDSHAEGYHTTASGVNSHAEGYGTTASGGYSHAEGNTTKATHKSQHVFGECNISDPSTNASTTRGTYVEIVGNGTSSGRSNARTLDWSGNQWIAGNYSDTNGLLAMKEVTQAQYDALTTAEKNNGTAYFITDRLSPSATDLWTKVGTATLTTTAQDCSGAINELNNTINKVVDAIVLANIGGWNTATTATAFNLSSGMKFSDYRFLIIQIRNYNNIIQTQTMLRSYFESTSSGARPLLYVNTDQYIGHVEVYYKSDTSVYIKVNSGNKFTANYRVYILGVQHSLS